MIMFRIFTVPWGNIFLCPTMSYPIPGYVPWPNHRHRVVGEFAQLARLAKITSSKTYNTIHFKESLIH